MIWLTLQFRFKIKVSEHCEEKHKQIDFGQLGPAATSPSSTRQTSFNFLKIWFTTWTATSLDAMFAPEPQKLSGTAPCTT